MWQGSKKSGGTSMCAGKETIRIAKTFASGLFNRKNDDPKLEIE